jgi:DNA-binding response OmpR family regulator
MTDIQNKTILVVEDEASLAAAVKTRLQTEGYTVVSAKSFEIACEKLESETIDAVWLDHYLLGNKSGLDLVHFMKNESSPFKQIPIFVVSNTASQDKVRSYMKIGVNKYYVKSDHKLAEIIAEINKHLGGDDGSN